MCDNIQEQTVTINLDGINFQPALIEDNINVFECPDFKIVKRSWQPDREAITCPLCKCKFGSLKRRHHCRQCGRVVCHKCCNEKVHLPQLGIAEAEKVCDACRPITTLVTKSRLQSQDLQLSAVAGLAEMCKDTKNLMLVFEFGGFHTLLAQVKGKVIGGLHTLVTYEPLHNYMVKAGIVKALCEVLGKMTLWQEQILLDAISALMIFCKSPNFIQAVLGAGALPTVLSLCSNASDTVALLSVRTLSMMVEHPGTHATIIDGDRQTLQRLLTLAASDNEQMQALTLKCLNYLSMGSDWNKHRIVQEDFSAGKPMKTALQSNSSNIQVLANAACLVANLSTSPDDQVSLSECRDCLIDILYSDATNIELLIHVTRGLANFAKFKQSSDKLISVLPVLVNKCLKHVNGTIAKHALRAVLNLLMNRPSSTTEQLLRDGAGLVLEKLVGMPDMMDCISSVLIKQQSDMAKPL